MPCFLGVNSDGCLSIFASAPRCLPAPIMLYKCMHGYIALCACVIVRTHVYVCVCVCVLVRICAFVHWRVSLNLFFFFFSPFLFYIYYVRQQMNHLYYGEI